MVKSPFGPRYAVVLLLAPALALTACGGKEKAGAPAALPTNAAAPASASPSESPSESPSASPPESTSKSASKSPSKKKRAASPGPGGRTPAPQASAMKTLADCLKKQGVKLPSSGQVSSSQPNFNAPGLRKALETCLKSVNGG